MATLPKDLPKVLEDAAYLSVGFGVLALQRAQVRRRELEQELANLGTELEEQLPEPARTLLASLRQTLGGGQGGSRSE
ncbi:MAG: hypothetical protein ACR2G7_03340 [Acidimicrobiales bacterium]